MRRRRTLVTGLLRTPLLLCARLLPARMLPPLLLSSVLPSLFMLLLPLGVPDLLLADQTGCQQLVTQ
jgi:hypothetical protein